ncbi:MAG: Na/Pi symporter [Cyclobacteriaceae bacterium]
MDKSLYLRGLMPKDKENIAIDPQKKPLYRSAIFITIAVYFFLLSINMISTAFSLMGSDIAESTIKQATANPFISLFIGLIITALLQSSSTVTAMTIAAVASNSISFQSAIPIIMGANIGTTITSTIVSLGFMPKKSEFRKAISAGTTHDIFNLLVILILFPLELKFQFLSKLCTFIGSSLHLGSSESQSSSFSIGFNAYLFEPVADFLGSIISNPYILLAFSFFLLFGMIKLLSNIIYKELIGRSKSKFEDFVFRSKLKSFGWGALITAMIQSSSVTTSLIVPLVATRKISLQKSFHFIMGANIGTTLTAVIAAMFRSEAAIYLAIAHLMINLIGVLIFMPFPVITKIPVMIANKLGALTLKNRLYGFAYIIIVFFLIPFVLIYISSAR